MSGPIDSPDAVGDGPGAADRVVELITAHITSVGALPVRRALPRAVRRTVGPWCFADHMGPIADSGEFGVAPHPHTGLQTVTWLLSGEIVHRDSLGSEQLIVPGQLNIMTAGSGVSHSEENPGDHRGILHGVQLWIAQPETTRHGAPAFDHHADLPVIDAGHATITVLTGEFAGGVSPARCDTVHVGLDIAAAPGSSILPLDPHFEYALLVLDGVAVVEDVVAEPGVLAYLGRGRTELHLVCAAPVRALLIGGPPWQEPLLMWWNFVARTREEIATARDDWMSASPRFGTVHSTLPKIPVGSPPWAIPRARQDD